MKNNLYLNRYAYPKSYFEIEALVGKDMLVVIPCFDEPDLIKTLNSLNEADIPKSCQVGVLVVINHGEDAEDAIKKRNHATLAQCKLWIRHIKSTHLSFQSTLVQFPQKHAGVGLARKIGMDDAVRAFDLSGKEGVIICLDADCTVDGSYFNAIWATVKDTRVNSASIYFEHEIDPFRKDEDPEGIALYEIYLRYYIDALRYAGYPHAVQTIGSSMAVRSSAYQKCGGMNRRKAGEDFYFIHKLLPLGGYVEINNTTVKPSSRVSTRVPFGTGAAIDKWIKDPTTLNQLYDPSIFEDFKVFIGRVDQFYSLNEDEVSELVKNLPILIRKFLEYENGVDTLLELKSRTTNLSAFQKQLWGYFDGLRVLKYVHFASEHLAPKVSVSEGLQWLFSNYLKRETPSTVTKSLVALREFDRTSEVRISP